MMASNNAVKCSIDGRQFPPSSYRLADDRKKWRRLCEERRMIALQLASYADGDGSNIEVGIKRVIRETEFSRATIFRRLDDLRRLGVLRDKDGLTGKRGTARRSIDFSKLPRPSARLSRSEEVSDTVKESQIEEVDGVQEVSNRLQEVSDSLQEISDKPQEVSPIRETQPLPSSDRPPTVTAQTLAGGLAAAFSKFSQEILSRIGLQEVMAAAKEQGCDDKEIQDRFKAWLRRRNITGLIHPLIAFSKEFEEAGILAAGERPEYSPEEMVEINANIDRQIAAQQAEFEKEAAERRAEEEYQRLHQNEI
jgi:hypothetical protein